jgi:3,4-dihydroxy 2-butanone 4-phosphate synthase/GTP cyclohydrolase II
VQAGFGETGLQGGLTARATCAGGGRFAMIRAMSGLFSPISEAIEAFKQGKILILVDDEDRENEGDFIFAAEHATPEKINFLARHGRGLICVPASLERLRQLDLEPYPAEVNTSLMGTNFTVSVDARRGVTTGISASDRCETVKIFARRDSRSSDLVRPGHIFPIAARPGGVLARTGHTEGTVDFCNLAGLEPAGVLCEIMREDGEMARLPDLRKLADEHKMPIVCIRDLIDYRRRSEKLIQRIVTTVLPNEFGEWRMTLYEDKVDGDLHVALVMGEPGPEPILVRMHSQCFTGDTLGSYRCDCGPQLKTAMKMIAAEGRGIIVYLHQEGRGIGLKNKLLAYALQEKGRDTVEANEDLGFKADLREYGIGAQILTDLGVKKMRLMTNNPRKIVGLEAFDLEMVERVPIEVGAHPCNEKYLASKRTRLGHLFGTDPVIESRGAE